jgi:hypothetical protein
MVLRFNWQLLALSPVPDNSLPVRRDQPYKEDRVRRVESAADSVPFVPQQSRPSRQQGRRPFECYSKIQMIQMIQMYKAL